MATLPIMPMQVTRTLWDGKILAFARAYSEIKNSESYRYVTIPSAISLGFTKQISLEA